MIALVAAASEHGSHFPIIGPGIVPLMVGLVVFGSWIGTRGQR